MKVTAVSISAGQEESIRFEMRAVTRQAPYQLRAIIGLDADDIIPKFYGFSANGTKRFYSAHLKPRDIVMRVVLNPRFHLSESHSDLRDRLYRFISLNREGLTNVYFHDGASTVAHIVGNITKFEVPHFSKTPELQMTIRCKDPLLRGVTKYIFTPEELPDVNPVSLTDPMSTAPHGFKMHVTFTGATSEFKIQDKQAENDWYFKIVPVSPFAVGDKLYFSSEAHDTYLYMERGDVRTHLMDRVDPGSVWPLIFPGFNYFWFNQINLIDWNYIQYENTYWGV